LLCATGHDEGKTGEDQGAWNQTESPCFCKRVAAAGCGHDSVP